MIIIKTNEGKHVLLEARLCTRSTEAHSAATEKKFDLEQILAKAIADVAAKIDFDAMVEAHMKGK